MNIFRKIYNREKKALDFVRVFARADRKRRDVILRDLISGIAAGIAWALSYLQAALWGSVWIGTYALAETITMAFVYGALTVGLSAATAALMQPDKPRSVASGGFLVNTKGQFEVVKVVYGECRVGGNIVYLDEAWFENRYLSSVITLGEGEIQGVKADGQGDMIYFNEARMQDYETFSGIFDLVDHWNHTGTPTQSVDTNLQDANYGNPDFNDAMRYTAYIAFRLKFNMDAWQGFPSITALVQGRKLYDPRDGSIAYSANNALVWLDFITNPIYGMGIRGDQIDFDAVCDAANWCDANSFSFNGAVLDYKPFIETIQEIMASFRGYMTWTNGKWYLRTLYWGTPVMALTEDDIISVPDKFEILAPGIPETPNQCDIIFADPVDNYMPRPVGVKLIDKIISDGEIRKIDIALLGITNFELGYKLGTYYVKRARYNQSYPLLCHPRTVALDSGDLVQLTHTFPGWTSNVARVQGMSLMPDNKVMILFSQELEAIYDMSGVEVAEHNPYNSTLPGQSGDLPEATNLTVVTGPDENTQNVTDAYLQFTWDNPGGVDFQLQYRKTTIAHWSTVNIDAPVGEISFPAFTGTGTAKLTVSGGFLAATAKNYRVQIDSNGTPDTFKWSDDGGSTWDVTGVNCSLLWVNLNNGIKIRFSSTTLSALNDYWDFTATPNNAPITEIVGGLPCNTEFYYKLRTKTPGEREYGDWITGDASITTWKPDPPDASLIVWDEITPTRLYMRLNWHYTGDDVDILYYHLFRNTVNTFATSTEITKRTKGLSYYNDTSVVSGQTYYYWLTIEDRFGQTSEA